MATAKISLTLDESLLAEARDLVARDALVYRVLKKVGQVPAATEEVGRTAGQLLGQAGSTAVADALVVAQAVQPGGAHILTGAAEDLERLAAPHPDVRIQPL